MLSAANARSQASCTGFTLYKVFCPYVGLIWYVAFPPCALYNESSSCNEDVYKRQVYNNVDKFFIIRIAWVFGKNGKNFIKTMLNVAKTHDTLKVVNDQIGTPRCV